ncbi:MAG: HAD family hydrolase [Treponema sp.]|jgi:phosphoglycolate phosphatase/putative hydrolase of the HAD superfamily|nr:HAD family hydrolase [Treponema sp.]
MKRYNLPARVSALIFDMDGTLYTHDEYLRFQIDSPIERLARVRGLSFEKMKEEIAGYRRRWAETHGGKQVSLGHLFKECFGISIEESIRWREELYEPARYLKPDPKLRDTLISLSAPLTLAVLTNNPVLVARKTLACLGVEDLFPVIVGLDTCGVSKPHEKPLRKVVELCGVPMEASVSVGDRYDIDLALPLELGMGGILVDGVEDVYKLKEFSK